MASKSVKSTGNIEVGDKVQIKPGGMDVTNGLTARANSLYGQGGPLWATVVGIYENWPTGGLKGLPATVTKVRCAGTDGSTIVWQVRPEDIADNIIKANPPPVEEEPEETPKEEDNTIDWIGWRNEIDSGQIWAGNAQMVQAASNPYAPKQDSSVWWDGESSRVKSAVDTLPSTEAASTVALGNHSFADSKNSSPTYEQVIPSTEGLPADVSTKRIKIARFPTAWQDQNKRKMMLNANAKEIQNGYGYPFMVSHDSTLQVASTYDYKFILDDPRFTQNGKRSLSLEDKLMKARAALGLTVHGNPDIAKSMKMYMYNRFRVPDHNMAFSKSFTHVFFTRPDLNILKGAGTSITIADQCCNHSESAMLWRTNPELFKLLVDGTRCGDANNFNLLLSNQVLNFDFEDDTLSTAKAGKAWDEHEVTYGDIFTGRHGGEFRCNFTETCDLSIIKLIRLWILYIDNVKRGVWHPAYNLYGRSKKIKNSSHIHSRALDYAASAYVFKCGPDGEDIIYWAKYYGIFPTNTGASALSWDSTTGSPDSPPKPNITFAYSAKEVMSPISLLEFNHNAMVDDTMIWLPAYNPNLAGTARPFVGAPYIEMDLSNSMQLTPNDIIRTGKRSHIRLKFREDSKASSGGSRRDEVLYRSNLSNIG